MFEREAVVGGCAGAIEGAGFQIDTGPSVLTMAGILSDTFAAAGADVGDHLQLRRLDPAYRACFADGSELRVRCGVEAMTEEIRAVCGAHDAAAFPHFCAWLHDLYQLELPHFIDRNYDSTFDLGREPAALARLVRLGAFRRLAPTVASYFDDPRLQQIFSFQSLYAGLSPFEALAVYCVITYMDTVEGVYFPDGGMHAIARELAAAATKAGADVTVAAPVERIMRRADGSVEGLRLESGERVRADAVISNVGVAHTYRSLLGIDAPRAVRRATYSPSCIVWVAGTRGTLPAGATHHNIHFGSDWRGAFDALGAGERMPDPSILVSVPTATDSSLAPAGGAVLFALEPVPNLGGTLDWSRDAPRARDGLVDQIGKLGYPVDDVVVERFTDPAGWEALGHELGTPFSIAHRFFQSGPFRPRNYDHRVAGLAFTGMGTVPGVGIPMVLLSGRLAAARVESFTGR